MTKCVLFRFLSGVELLIGSNTRLPRVCVVIGPSANEEGGSVGYGEREDRKGQS